MSRSDYCFNSKAIRDFSSKATIVRVRPLAADWKI